jgi:solute carrier family 25 oxoglutarate transporter 11
MATTTTTTPPPATAGGTGGRAAGGAPKKAGAGLQFLFGGLSGMAATCIVQPLDLVKTRMQLSGAGGGAKLHKTSFHAILNIAHTEGVPALYKGLTAGLLRQATYTTARLGMYNVVNEALVKRNGGNAALPFWQKLASGMFAGGFGAVIGTPAEVALIRMTSDGRLPPEQRRGYKNAFDALYRICKEEGVLTMWRGCTPTVLRAMVLNAAQLGTYTQSKETLMYYFPKLGDTVTTHLLASTMSGFWATAVSIPVDITKTRIQTMKVVNGVPEYTGVVDVVSKVIKQEGVTALWKGFTPYFLRLGPHTIFTFLILEQMNQAYSRFASK